MLFRKLDIDKEIEVQKEKSEKGIKEELRKIQKSSSEYSGLNLVHDPDGTYKVIYGQLIHSKHPNFIGADRLRMKMDKFNFLVELAEQRGSRTLTAVTLGKLLDEYKEAIVGKHSKVKFIFNEIRKELEAKNIQEEMNSDKFIDELRERIKLLMKVYEVEIEVEDKRSMLVKQSLYYTDKQGNCIKETDRKNYSSRLLMKVDKYNFLSELNWHLEGAYSNELLIDLLKTALKKFPNATSGVKNKKVKTIVDELRKHIEEELKQAKEQKETELKQEKEQQKDGNIELKPTF